MILTFDYLRSYIQNSSSVMPSFCTMFKIIPLDESSVNHFLYDDNGKSCYLSPLVLKKNFDGFQSMLRKL
jgi:hypothetical protein